ncbi:hypothetical protein CHUAL_002773 [Chamberlinius hualienensis]
MSGDGPKSRSKRSFSHDLHVEVMVTADHTMKEYHGDSLHEYILTLMSVVAHIFRDASLGNSVTIAVVKIVVTDEAEDEAFVSSSAPRTLRSFCKWQAMHNYRDDSYYLHYDVAILLTRVDICRSPKKCDTLGLADLGTMCNEYNSCAIIEDNGLSAAFTIAHELGHVLNLPHDDDIRCLNFSGYGSNALKVMARFLDQNTDPWSWSDCSAHYLTEFLDTEAAKCLRDKPTANKLTWSMLKELPGQSFTADRQCELLYGDGYRICPYMPTCDRLWCLMAENLKKGCRTHHMPWADGTNCAVDSWCFRGRCRAVSSISLKVGDGGWGRWSDYGPCSRTCGGGIRKSIRHCDHPKPTNGGKYCTGERIRYQSCQTQDCPEGSVDFREQQCSHFDTFHFTALGLPPNIHWVPKYSGVLPHQRCKLYCRVATSSDYYVLKDKVVDGTPCGLDTFDICVNGQCMPAGCDHKLYSKMKLDNCGECGGKDQNCRSVTGHFNVTHYGYNRVVYIPAGSVNVDVKQYGFQRTKEDDNYLALLSDTNEYILNGEFTVTTSKKRLEYGGAVLEYTGSNVVVERINSSRPLKRDLFVEVLSVGKLHPPDIQYQYNEPVERNSAPKYSWELEDGWSNCSKICKGQQIRRHLCIQRHSGKKSNDDRCRKLAPMPSDLSRSCNDHCALSWTVADKDECITEKGCGTGIVQQTIICEQKWLGDGKESIGPIHLDIAHCQDLAETKPPDKVTCYKECSNEVYWEYTLWTPCSRSCEGGTQTRQARCKSAEGHFVSEVLCVNSEREVTLRACSQEECPKWRTGEWTKCSKDCGGQRLRPIWCQIGNHNVSHTLCDPDHIPISQENCSTSNCYVWDFGHWSQCSVTCGEGSVRRLVRCRTVDGQVTNDTHCNPSSRPKEWSPCSIKAKCEDNDDGEEVVNDLAINTAIEEHGMRWKIGPWSQCSVSCGEGIEKRQVICVGSSDEILSKDRCKPNEAPKSERNCHLPSCPKWIFINNWSNCSRQCGGGNQWRTAVCSRASLRIENSFCQKNNYAKPPVESRACGMQKCPNTGRWKRHQWSPCSRNCYQSRIVQCTDDHGRALPDQFCSWQSKPKSIKRCRKCISPFVWVKGAWSECSSSCGAGYRTRTVSCHAANHYGWIRPEPHSPETACNVTERPAKVQNCNLGECEAPYRWVVGPWNSCSVSCGSGNRKRRVYCVDRSGQKVPRRSCPSGIKPVRKQKCRMRTCTSTNCLDVKQRLNKTKKAEDGDYEIWIRGKSVKVHCADMTTSQSPKEYINLPGNDHNARNNKKLRKVSENNFSEVYEKRLIEADSCPEGGRRLDTCHCMDTGPMAGLTLFSKIRLNITNLRVIVDDFRFTEQVHGSPIPYGEAGDCYSLKSCPQGKFSIDLGGTGFVVAEKTTWFSHGHRPHRQITASSNRQRINGQCGGYCGVCMPDPSQGLLLDVEQPS